MCEKLYLGIFLCFCVKNISHHTEVRLLQFFTCASNYAQALTSLFVCIRRHASAQPMLVRGQTDVLSQSKVLKNMCERCVKQGIEYVFNDRFYALRSRIFQHDDAKQEIYYPTVSKRLFVPWAVSVSAGFNVCR